MDTKIFEKVLTTFKVLVANVINVYEKTRGKVGRLLLLFLDHAKKRTIVIGVFPLHFI